MKSLIPKFILKYSEGGPAEKKNARLKILIPAIIAVTALTGLIIFVFNETYESKYITVELSGDAEEFNGYINFLNDKNGVEGITLTDDLPQEHKLKTHRLYVHLELISGEEIFVEYYTKGELIRKDTVYSGLYKRNISVDEDKYRGTIVPGEPPMDLPPEGK
jgi:hypothetical protein